MMTAKDVNKSRNCYEQVMQVMWNPWHGCTKVSAGCLNCYVDRLDKRFGRDPKQFIVTGQLQLPASVDKRGNYKYPAGTKFMTCFTSDFLLKDADDVRKEAWNIIAERDDCEFFFVTKRIDRFMECVPDTWGFGWPNVTVCCTVENQEMADYRLPIFKELPIVNKYVIVEPMLEAIDLSKHLSWIDCVGAGGESGPGARTLDIKWIYSLRRQCIEQHVPFWFKQTGARLLDGDSNLVSIARNKQYDKANDYYLSTCNWMFDDNPLKSDYDKFCRAYGTCKVYRYPEATGQFEPWMHFIIKDDVPYDSMAYVFVWDTRQFLFKCKVEDLPVGYVRADDNYKPLKF